MLTSRIGWLAAVTAVVILASSQLLYTAGEYSSYAESIYQAAMAAITGSGVTANSVAARVIQVLLAIYSVAVFATLAATVGAYLVRKKDPE